MKKHILQIILLLFLSFCTSCGTISAVTIDEEEFCVEPVAEYSVPIEVFYVDGEIRDILPGNPWEMQSQIPIKGNSEYPNAEYNIGSMKIQNEGDHAEIWIYVSYYEDKEDLSTKEIYYLIFNTKTEEWKKVSATIYDNLNGISEIYFSNSGKIWGLNISYESQYTNSMLSFFDEDKNRFITDERGRVFTELVPISGKTVGNEVVFDKSGYLWILVEYDGIYKYELGSGELSREVDIPNGDVYSARILEDGNLYFVMYTKENNEIDVYGDEKGLIFVYSPKQNEISTIKLPEEALLEGTHIPSRFLYDAEGRFWVSNLAYQETDGQWYQVLYSPLFLSDQFEEEQTDRKYNEMEFSLQSSTSDGRLWYTSRMMGTYFTDPDEQKWCWVTTEVSTVLEDGQGYLWMIADDSLYKRPLDED